MTAPPAPGDPSQERPTPEPVSGATPGAISFHHRDGDPPAGPAWPAQVGRYTVEGEIGRGGMGVVLRAFDPACGRPLALKVLVAGEPSAELEQRFVEEAQLTAQLQHPGVAPVYEIGRLDDGRPFFAMKLVKGRTLADLLEERASPAQDLPRFLAVFAQVCQTLAYAHSRGILHRDLKPSNVMVGAFGEVQVMDWGLAKVLSGGRARPGPADTEPASTICTVRTGPAGLSSQAGTVLGTPAYMAPEQARGAVDQLDERTDVFGLGGLLCEILTGQPPYVAPSKGQVYELACWGELDGAHARLAGCGAEAELVRLARACLARRPEERPRDAGAVAGAVAAYQAALEERLRQAELAQAAAQARAAEERKRRRLLAALAAALLALLALGGAGAWWWQQQEAQRRREVESALEKAAEWQRQARWDEARAVLDQAQYRLGDSAPIDLLRRVRQAQADLQLVDRLDNVRMQLVIAVAGRKLDEVGVERRYAAAFRDSQLGQPGDDVGAVAARIRASAVKDELVATLDDWAWLARNPRHRVWLLAVARRADPHPWPESLRNPQVWQDRKTLQRLARRAIAEQWSPQLVITLGIVLRCQGGNAIPLLTAAQRRYPQDFWLNFALGNALLEAQKSGEAVGYYRAALALRPKAGSIYIQLGNAMKDQGRTAEAIACFRKALQLDPKDAMAHSNLGLALAAEGQVTQAIACHRQAIKVNTKYAPAHYNLGLALHHKGQLDGAIACYRKALALEPKFAPAHYNLGIALKAKGDLDGAIACFQRALALDPKLAHAHNNLGAALAVKGEWDRAIACYQKALALDPKHAQAHTALGAALQAKGQLDRAIACYKKALDLDRKDAGAHANLGTALYAKGDLDGAVACFQKALALDPTFAGTHYNLGVAWDFKGELDQAIACYRKALELDPKLAKVYYNLGHALGDQGDVAGAISAYRKALILDPMKAEAHCNLGLLLQQRGQFTEALAALRRGHQLGSQNPRWPYPSDHWVRQAERWVQLDAQLPKLLQGAARSASAAERLEYAGLCKSKKLYAAAARFYAGAFAVDPKLADKLLAAHRYNAACAAVLATASQGKNGDWLAAGERDRWRRQAVTWLRADLARWTKILEVDTPQARTTVHRKLRRWQRDPALAGIRDAAWLANLPADELRACRLLWADVDALLKRAGSPK
jgi:tetratricopeptide (TPR) repeat protein